MSQAVQTLCTAFLTGGGCSILLYLLQRHDRRHDDQADVTAAIIGLEHDRLYTICGQIIARGYSYSSELENLDRYIFEPYKALGGDGSGDKLMNDVKALPTYPDNYNPDEDDK